MAKANGNGRNEIHEINEYFSIGCWGNSMDGIAPQRGAWITTDYDKPVQIINADGELINKKVLNNLRD